MAALLAITPAPAATAPAELKASDYAGAGTLVRLNSGRALDIRCIGTGYPTVILTAGAGEQSLTWRSLQSELAKTTHVCAWDRAGFGFSDPSPEIQDTEHTTRDLEAILSGAKISPPYVLVGHSLGSYETLMFSFHHAKEVAGVVLIDPSAPFQTQRLKAAAPATYAVIDGYQQKQVADLKSCIGWLGEKANDSLVAANCISPPDPAYPESLQHAVAQWEHNAAAQKNVLSLLESIFNGRDSQELKASWKHLDAMPLIVLTAGAPPPVPLQGEAKMQLPKLQSEWSKMHDEIAALSTHGTNRVVSGATHYIYLDRPAVVLATVREVLAGIN
ncbi:MAG TPA: alpha/beta hydrolase [Steroidobacteraceae bacterium]|jgi:pimeloyl-ACP methyl ester carboxylesterase